jgi:peptide/nickel transport system permease protein
VTTVRYLRHYLWTHPTAMAGVVISVVLVLLIPLAPLVVPFSATAPNAAQGLLPPSASHWFGTDTNGTDILSRVLYAPRIDLLIALSGTAISFAIGSVLGVVVGFLSGRRGVGGWFSEAVMRIADIVQAFPVFVLALALVAVLGNSARNVVAAIAFLNIPVYLRLVRARALSVRSRTYIDAARCGGAGDLRTISRHLLPNCLTPAFAQVSVNFGWAILLTAGLSFVGAGVVPPTPEWGLMVSQGSQNIITGQWWPSLFPGLAIAVAVLGFALLGETLEHVLDPAQWR